MSERVATIDAYVTINDTSGGKGNEYEVVIEEKYTDREAVTYIEQPDELTRQLIEQGFIDE